MIGPGSWRPLVLAAAAGLSLGCVRGCPSSRPPIHPVPNMDWQERLDPQEESDFFYDGAGMRAPVPGTVPRERLVALDGRLAVAPDPYRGDAAYHGGKDAAGEFLAALPVAEDEALVERGAQRYDIYCRPCHDARGNGQGVLTERASVPVPSFHDPRLVEMRPGEIFDTVTHGKGLMPGYAYPIPAGDRWAIIAHVRRLQRERATRVAGVVP
jgi:hypothetical protein